MIHCKKRQFQAGRDTQFIENVAEVMLYCVFGDFEIGGDLFRPQRRKGSAEDDDGGTKARDRNEGFEGRREGSE